MGLLEKIRTDIEAITQKDFAVDITFQSGTTTKTIKGLYSNHNLGFNSETGLPVNTRNVHCSFKEDVLTATGFPVRDSNGKLLIINCLVTIEGKKFKVNQTFPNATTKLIVCILGDYV